MTIEKLRQLLDEFYAGQSNPARELELREYFATHADVDSEFAADAALFRAMDSASADMPADLGARIERATVGRRARRVLRLPLIGSVAAAAAVVLILVSIAPSQSPYREVTDPAEATEIAMQVSQKLQKNVNKLKLLNNINI